MGNAKIEWRRSAGRQGLQTGGPAKIAASYETFFPCVHGQETGELVRLRAFVAQSLKATVKVTSAAIEDAAALRVVGAARDAELDDRMALSVIASVSKSTFTGASYELALAIADKLARYGSSRPRTCLIATGRIPADGCGVVKGIDQFETKLKVVLRDGSEDSVFVFPDENLSTATENEKALLARLDSCGIEWFAISHIDDLSGTMWPSTHLSNGEPVAPRQQKYRSPVALLKNLRFRPPHWAIVATAFGALFVGLMIQVFPLSQADEQIIPATEIASVNDQPPEEASPSIVESDFEMQSKPAVVPIPKPLFRHLESGLVEIDAY